MKIDPHDVMIRVEQAHRFLMEGHKVQIVQNFRGRELMHRHLGDQRMREIIEKLADVSRVETPPRMAGRRMTVILAPDKPKIDAILRKQAKQSKKPGDGQAAPDAGGAASASVPTDSSPVPLAGDKAQSKRKPVLVPDIEEPAELRR